MTIQRLYQTASGQVATDGTISLTFASVPTLQTWSGSINVYDATGSEKWQATVSGAIWGTFIGNAQFGTIQAHSGQKISITGTGLTAGASYNAVLIGTSSAEGEIPYDSPDVQPLTLAQITSAIATFGAQEHLTNSPFSFQSSPQTQSFPLPAGGPSIDGLMLLPYPSQAGQTTGTIKVVGHNTGVVYIQTAVGSAPFVCDFSSSADPGGVDVTFTLIGGAGNVFKLAVIGLNRSQIVRPVHGSLAEGPTDLLSVAIGSAGGAANGTFFQVPNNGQYRIWAASIHGVVNTASVSGYGNIVVGSTSLVGVGLTNPGQGGNSLTIPGGLTVGGLVTVGITTSTANVFAEGSVLYSIDA